MNQVDKSTLINDPTTSALESSLMQQWGGNAPKGAKAVFSRIIKEGANVPLFLGQTLINALRDLGYNNTTSAICEHVDNAIQWGAKEVRIYFNEIKRGKQKEKTIDVLILDDGVGMAPNVLRAVTAFGGSMCYDNRTSIGRYGVGMKAAALSIGPVLEIYSWQEKGAIYNMTLDLEDIGNDRSNVVNLGVPRLIDGLPAEIRDILTSSMSYPKNQYETQEVLTTNPGELIDRLGESGTIIFIPNCDRLTYRTVRSLVDHATKEMARIYRRKLESGVTLFINNRRVEPFDPTYRMESAWHSHVEGLQEKRSRLVQNWEIDIPIEEGGEITRRILVRLFILPIEDWDRLPLKVLRNELRVFDSTGISFMRSDREVYIGHMVDIAGKQGTRDSWWRLEVDFPPDLDEAFGVAVNKQGVRPKSYVEELIRKEIKEDLTLVRKKIEQFWSQRATEDKPKLSEAERRANEAEALQSTLLPELNPHSEEEKRELEAGLRVLAKSLKKADETDEQAYERIKNSRYITTFKHDEDAAFYRVDFPLGKIILTINTAHPFFEKLYKPLSELAKRAAEINTPDDDLGPNRDLANIASEALISLQLFLLSLARTQSEMTIKDDSGERQRTFDILRKQWTLNLETQLNFR